MLFAGYLLPDLFGMCLCVWVGSCWCWLWFVCGALCLGCRIGVLLG